MSLHRLVCLAAALLSGCSMHSNWYLMDSGYSINPVDGDAQVRGLDTEMLETCEKLAGGPGG